MDVTRWKLRRQIIVAGRDREKLAANALKIDVDFRAFSLDDPDTIDKRIYKTRDLARADIFD
ncbi:hypothetical protein BM280_11410 [Klebsiella michiganensis]|nr:hypothetical protein APT98_19420 [Klebsiella quasipneumoniae]OSY93741.1 hypothetical protein BM280_11410 [Klebsiella michiganensis]